MVDDTLVGAVIEIQVKSSTLEESEWYTSYVVNIDFFQGKLCRLTPNEVNSGPIGEPIVLEGDIYANGVIAEHTLSTDLMD